MSDKRESIEYCHTQGGNLVGRHDRTGESQRSSWFQLEATIRDEGLDEAIKQCQEYIESARKNQDQRRSYDTTVERAFLSWLGIS